MGYQRAGWHSGLTYQQKCDTCHTTVTYKDDKLGFRPWYADGFVYCPTCKKPLRHNEKYAIDNITTPSFGFGEEERPAFCTNCGNALKPDDNFCSSCGTKII